jgi:hypothetical protein
VVGHCFNLRLQASKLAVAVTLLSISGLNGQGCNTNAPKKNAARMNCGAQIECVTPDGRPSVIARLPAQDPNATALIAEDDTITCLLQEGETDFVIEIPKNVPLDRFTFLNENAAARGELRIAVANQRLPANSPEWSEVEGIVPFSHKRLFGVSLIGIDARFVRLAFHVEKEGKIAALAVYSNAAENKSPGDPNSKEARNARGFQVSGLDDALNSKFATMHARESNPLASSNSFSVAPLSSPATD